MRIGIRQMRILFVTAIVAALFTPMTARADWQYTKWGMSPAQTQQASRGALRAVTPAEAPKKSIMGVAPSLIGTYTAGPLQFEATLYFQPAGLYLVHLTQPDSGRNMEALAALRGAYGEPVSNETSMVGKVYRWRDDNLNLSVEAYSFSKGGFTINYQPLRTAASGRL